MGNFLRLTRREQGALGQLALDEELVTNVADRFLTAFESDDGRDLREFERLLFNYKYGSAEYRRGVDRTFVTLTGYRLMSVILLATGTPEEDLEPWWTVRSR